jgi:hypothetical protein
MSACLWQANPSLTVMELYDGLKESSSHYSNPDNKMGFGIPDYAKANSILTTIEYQVNRNENKVHIWPNPFITDINLQLSLKSKENLKLELLSITGAVMHTQTIDFNDPSDRIRFNGLSGIPQGVYFLRVTGKDWVEVKRIIKQ